MVNVVTQNKRQTNHQQMPRKLRPAPFEQRRDRNQRDTNVAVMNTQTKR